MQPSEIPTHERLITVEDAREVILQASNRVHLLRSKRWTRRAKVTIKDLIEACLRLRPDKDWESLGGLKL